MNTHENFFVWPLTPLIWASGDVSSGLSKPDWADLFMLGGGICVTHSLRFTSDVTPTDLLAASMAAQLFYSTYLCPGIGGSQNWDLLCYTTSQSETRQML